MFISFFEIINNFFEKILEICLRSPMNQQANSFNKGSVVLPPDLEMPKGHEKYSLKDKEKCPYFQISEKTKDIPTTLPTNKGKF